MTTPEAMAKLLPDAPACVPTVSRAVLSSCGAYRYRLERRWGDPPRLLGFIMLNPSTADAELDDPTIRRCKRFAEDAGFNGIVVGNLFAYRATDPREMKMASAPIGPENDEHLKAICREVETVVCAWGTNGSLRNRDQAVLRLIRLEGCEPHCLSLTAKGAPQHPLYLPADLRPKVMK